MGVSLITLISMMLFGVGVALVRWRSYLFGKTTEKAEAQEKTLDDIEKANNAIVRAKSDKSLADKLRDRYGIK